MKHLLAFAVIVLAGCSREPVVSHLDLPVEPERESVVDSVQKMSDAEVQKAEEPYRTWLIAQRSGECERHHAKMERRWIPVAYGLPAAGSFPEPDVAAEFPHGEEFWLGGCVVTPTKEREVFLCPVCVSAYRAWREKKKEPIQPPQTTTGSSAPSRV